jgi:hypothetical protein
LTKRCCGPRISTAISRARVAALPRTSEKCYPCPKTISLPMSSTVQGQLQLPSRERLPKGYGDKRADRPTRLDRPPQA